MSLKPLKTCFNSSSNLCKYRLCYFSTESTTSGKTEFESLTYSHFVLQHPFARLTKIDVTTPLVVCINLYDGLVKSTKELHEIRDTDDLKRRLLDSVTLNRWLMSSSTERIELTLEKDGICGTLFVPPGKGPFPGDYLDFLVPYFALLRIIEVSFLRSCLR